MNDKPFLPASPNKTAPYLTSVNTHSPYYGMGPGDSHPAFGFTTFRDEPKDAAKSKVWNVQISHSSPHTRALHRRLLPWCVA